MLDGDLEERVEAQVTRSRRQARTLSLALNITFSLFFLMMLVVTASTLDSQPTTAGVLILAFLGIIASLGMHILAYANEVGAFDQQRRRQILEKEIKPELIETMLAQAREKSKRKGQPLALSDDGELVPVEDAEIREDRSAKR